jgi:Response regulator containing a CheY-like receiver domain and an HD-GYP domain
VNTLSLKNKIKNNKFFSNAFGFESGIDIADDTQVLFRKNVVIKNIIFLSNLVFTIIFTFLSFGERSNIILAILLGLVTFLVNIGLKRTIYKNPGDITTQTIASFVACFYMFLLSIVIYLKLKFGSVVYLQECGYILIYYSLAVCSFYQNKKLLRVVFEWVLVLVTILHFTVTYGIVFSEMASDIQMFFTTFFVSDEFKDILLRTILLCIFMLVLYSIVSMSGYMQEERKKELQKRREVQKDFTNVVSKIFEVTLDNSSRSEEDKQNIYLISKMAKRLSELLSLPSEECEEVENFAKIHIEQSVNFDPSGATEDDKFELLREQTNLGSIIISRLQLERKCENIIRSTFEESNTNEFIIRMKTIQNEIHSQIILICELYTTMRSVKSYKKAYNHKLTMQYMTEQFKVYFEEDVFERFVRFKDEFEKIFDGNEGEDYEL